ncbi:TetR/AcrR family transcriptional regulator [Roseibium denhamense]|uniref:Transcriptional regulator, TetR family n=1 Tax=Roseibium denhamense TaxID=76305 RepID=A0ABY1P8L5_9HYPH|nr:TetR/AcrR family transcriptional regulator [Roseibium denhamense]MTI07327.1 TetR/AcrR family transcriptional regulator [Roseibium denhamense]SMP28815.1 transcriptional regulator, TetR family [Roseibium denhamense]
MRNAAVTEDKILDLAESLIRKNGYNGVSFREIASGVGVKSSSVHYYFPAKKDLGVKVARRYADRFLEKLGDPSDAPDKADDVLKLVHRLFVEAMGEDGRMCLCGVLAAESAGLPERVAAEARVFFDRTLCWLVDALRGTIWGAVKSERELNAQALAAMSQLEGGLLMARVYQKPALLKQMKLQLIS